MFRSVRSLTVAAGQDGNETGGSGRRKPMRTSLDLWIGLLLCLGVSGASDASLIDNLDGTVTQIREDGSMLMWLQDFSLSGQSPSAESLGRLRWDNAVAWADQLSFAGHDDWRLPTALNFDGRGPELGFNVTTSEFWNLYYLELGGTVGAPDGSQRKPPRGSGRRGSRFLERETGLEPATLSLGNASAQFLSTSQGVHKRPPIAGLRRLRPSTDVPRNPPMSAPLAPLGLHHRSVLSSLFLPTRNGVG